MATTPFGHGVWLMIATAKSPLATRIEIDLDDDPRDAYTFSSTTKLIQQEALEKIAGLIRRNLENIEADERERQAVQPGGGAWRMSIRRRHHDVISIHGQRGSGKTTLILNVLAAIEKDKKFCEKVNTTPGNIVSAGLIDPTLIETKENILVTIIANIKQLIDEQRNRYDYGSREADYATWEGTLRTLAEGLCLLDNIGGDRLYGEDWQDAEFILDRGLQRAASGGAFEKHFHDFVEKSLRFLSKDAFMLAFDDIDTAFDRGWPVLETIRK
jgi:Cdc6-like AAA superfamily ATPase